MCGKDKYSIISDFQWYVSVLVVLAVLPSNEGTIGTYSGRSSCLSSGHCGGEIKSKQGSLSSVNKTLISEQLIDISFRVEAVRPYAMETMLSILLSSDLILGKMKEGVYEVSICMGCRKLSSVVHWKAVDGRSHAVCVVCRC